MERINPDISGKHQPGRTGLLRTMIFGSNPPFIEGWRSLRDGMTAEFAFLQADVAGHSRISRTNPSSLVEAILGDLEMHIDAISARYEGRIWNWAGDGGLIAFHEGQRTRKVVAAVSAAMEVLQSLPAFNAAHPLEVQRDEIRMRLAIHCGTAHYRTNTGRIHSPAINFVAHMEHERTHVNSVSLSEDVYRELPANLRERLVSAGMFEDIPIYTSDLQKRAGFPKGLGKWRELIENIQLVAGKLRPVHEDTVMVGFYRSSAVIGGMLAPNIGIKNVTILGRERIHDELDRSAKLTDALRGRPVIFVSLAIDSADAIVRKLDYLRNAGVSEVVVASLFVSPNALLRLRERKVAVVAAEERELTSAFWDTLPWVIGAEYDHR